MALVVSLAALWYAHRQYGLAQKQYGLSRDEHEAFMQQLRARAKLALTVTTPPWPDGIIHDPASTALIRLRLELRNVGAREARQVRVTVLAPPEARMYWSGPDGAERDRTVDAVQSSEVLVGPTGQEWGARRLSTTVPIVTTRPSEPLFATLHVFRGLPMPVRVRAESSDLAEDDPGPTQDLVIGLED